MPRPRIRLPKTDKSPGCPQAVIDSPSTFESEIDKLAARVATLTIANDGHFPPTPDRSHDEHQTSLMQSTELPVQYILEGAREVLINSGRSESLSSPSRNNRTLETASVVRANNIALLRLKAIEKVVIEMLASAYPDQPTVEVVYHAAAEAERLRNQAEKVSRKDLLVTEKKNEVLNLLDRLDEVVTKLFESVGINKCSPARYDCGHHFDWPVENENDIVQMVMFISIVCLVIFRLSRNATDTLLRLLQRLVDGTVSRTIPRDIGDQERLLVAAIPIDSRTVRRRYGLDGKTITYAACPKCDFTYRPACSRESTHPTYPSSCTNIPYPGATECGEPLTVTISKGVSTFHRPIKPFVYYSVFDYISGLTSEVSIETAIDKACDDLYGKCNGTRTACGSSRGVFEGNFLTIFQGPQPTKLFVDRGDEIRIAFALNLDFFNVDGLRKNGAIASCGVISMICLNLPENIRYKPENIYVAGLIPGPHEPELERTNHYFKPLLDDMLTLWDPGVRLSRTASNESGRVARGAIVLASLDLVAARKAAALAAHSHNKFPCSSCECPQDGIGDIEKDFPNRSAENLRRNAEKWKYAPTQLERDRIFNDSGTRWSEFWRLPYWDPTKQLVVDPMHCLLEGLVHHHFRRILRLTSKEALTPPLVIPAFQYVFKEVPLEDSDAAHSVHDRNNGYHLNDLQMRQVKKIHRMLVEPFQEDLRDERVMARDLAKRLEKLQKDPLAFVCSCLNLAPVSLAETDDVTKSTRTNSTGPLKIQYANALTRWRMTKPLHSPVPLVKFNTPEFIEHIRHVIRHVSKPTWVGSVPQDFGDARVGKLKCAEWRTLCTVHLPLALITFWADKSKQNNDATARQVKNIVDHTMHLVSAVTLALRRSTNATMAAAYETHIKKYVSTLQVVHPQARPVPNMHMAKHISEFLMLFGPAYSWWTFPFERLISLLQTLPRNNKLGEYEKTILHSFISASRLRRWFSRSDCPPGIKACKALCDKMLWSSMEEKRQTRLSDASRNLDEDVEMKDAETSDAEMKDIEMQEVELECERRIYISREQRSYKHYELGGVRYSISTEHRGNSQIIYFPEGSRLPVPAIIRSISDEGRGIYLTVQRLLPKDDMVDDIFSDYFPDFPAKLYSANLAKPEVISLNMIHSHFASFELDPFHVIVLSLFRG